jgi:hypothetical protein
MESQNLDNTQEPQSVIIEEIKEEVKKEEQLEKKLEEQEKEIEREAVIHSMQPQEPITPPSFFWT